MRRRDEGPLDDSLARFEELQRSGEGLELLRASMKPGATLAEARRLRERIMQAGRTPCSFLDETAGE